MNHTYRVIYNESTNTFVAVSEIVSAKGKKSKGKKSASHAGSVVAAVGVAVAGGALTTVPTEAEAAVTITQSNANGVTSNTDSFGFGTAKGRGLSISIGEGANTSHDGAIALGVSAVASGDYAVAIGSPGSFTKDLRYTNNTVRYTDSDLRRTVARGSQAIALGSASRALGDQSSAIGNDVLSVGIGSIAIGNDDTQDSSQNPTVTFDNQLALVNAQGAGYINTGSFGQGSNAIGAHSQALSKGSTAIGVGAAAGRVGNYTGAVAGSYVDPNFRYVDSGLGANTTAIGAMSYAANNESTAIGSNSRAYSERGVSIGYQATTGGNTTATMRQDTIAIGTNATALNNYSIIIGTNASNINNSAQLQGEVVIGHNAVGGSQAASVVIGSGAKGHTIDNVIGSGHVDYQNPYTIIKKGSGSTLTRNSDGTEFSSGVVALGRDSEANAGGVALGDNARTTRVQTSNSTSRGLGVAIGANAWSQGGGVVIGSSATTEGINAMAIGRQAVAKNSAAQAIGVASAAVGTRSLAIGQSATSIGEHSISIGSAQSNEIYNATTNVRSEGKNSIAIGSQARIGENYQAPTRPARDANMTTPELIAWNNDIANESTRAGAFTENSIAIGANAIVKSKTQTLTGTTVTINNNASNSVAIGANATVTSNSSVATGHAATASGENSTAIGRSATASHADTIAIGTNANATGINNIAGSNANSNALGSILIGANSHLKGAKENNINIGTLSNGDTPFVLVGYNTSSQSRFGDTIVGAWAKSENSKFEINQATVIGNRALVYGDQGVAVGADTRALGNSSVAIGGDDLDKASAALKDLLGHKNVDDVSKNYGTFRGDVDTTLQSYLPAAALNGKVYPNTAAIGDASLAIGTGSQTFGVASNAIGANALAKGLSSTAIGTKSRAWGESSIAIGTNANASGKNAISIGLGNQVSGNNSGAIGDPSIVAGTNSYSMGNNNIIANNTDNAISIGGQNKIGGDATRTNGVVTDTNVSNVTNAKTGANRSMVIGFNNTVSADDVMVLGNNINVTNTAQVGTTPAKSYNGSVILGQNASTAGSHDIANVTNTTLNGIEYGDFVGTVADAGRFVSVGAKGDERKIINVAAGNISASSTEAINGSQLYAVIDKMPNKGNIVSNPAGNVSGPVTTLNDAVTGAQTALDDALKNDPTAQDPATQALQAALDDAKKNLANAPNLYATAQNVADSINSSSWTLQNHSKNVGQINPGDKVNFTSDDKTVVINATNETNGVSTLDFAVNVDGDTITINDKGQLVANVPPGTATTVKEGDNVKVTGTPTEGYTISANNTQANVIKGAGVNVVEGTNDNGTKSYTVSANVDGDTITTTDDGKLVAKNTQATVTNGKGITVTEGDVNGNGTKNYVVSANTDVTTSPNDNGTMKVDDNKGDNLVNGTTLVNTVNNASFNLTTGGNTDTKDTTSKVKAGDTVTISGGKAISVSQAGSEITINTKYDGTTITTNDAGDLQVANTTLTQPTTPVGTTPTVAPITKPSDENSTKFVNAGDLANTLNNLGFNVDSAAAGGTVSGNAKTAVKTGDTVTFKAGDNIDITQDGQNFTISAKATDVNVANTTLTVTDDGTVAPQDPASDGDKLVNASTVTDAINKTGFKVKMVSLAIK
ncbi:ESPR-type extended signal peptide-containing protein [Moraxella oblonga]|uniref:ESPR-type extended signal peptide-containing protein n=1 Tax=Moraxella oblonga TaxID=200413 RepID=UPI0008308826|nr:ESPR-type extended signal peptide-containing protein [Moraxella oblonga]